VTPTYPRARKRLAASPTGFLPDPAPWPDPEDAASTVFTTSRVGRYVDVMERSARRLLVYSFASLVVVLAFGTLRGTGPVRAWLDGPELLRNAALFHSHFDQLCWLGAAAAGATLWILRDAYGGPAWAPTLFAWSYPAGTLLFSSAFLVKVVGLRVGSATLARFAFGALVSVGGALLVVAMVSGAAIARGLVRGNGDARAAG
jgi:hypothetical protein